MNEVSLEHLQAEERDQWKGSIEQTKKEIHQDVVVEQMQGHDRRNEPYVLLSAGELASLPMAWSVGLSEAFCSQIPKEPAFLCYGWAFRYCGHSKEQLLQKLHAAMEDGMLGFALPDEPERYGIITEISAYPSAGLEAIPIVCMVMKNLTYDDMIQYGFAYPFIAKYGRQDLTGSVFPETGVELLLSGAALPDYPEGQDWHEFVDLNILKDLADRERDRIASEKKTIPQIEEDLRLNAKERRREYASHHMDCCDSNNSSYILLTEQLLKQLPMLRSIQVGEGLSFEPSTAYLCYGVLTPHGDMTTEEIAGDLCFAEENGMLSFVQPGEDKNEQSCLVEGIVTYPKLSTEDGRIPFACTIVNTLLSLTADSGHVSSFIKKHAPCGFLENLQPKFTLDIQQIIRMVDVNDIGEIPEPTDFHLLRKLLG